MIDLLFTAYCHWHFAKKKKLKIENTNNQNILIVYKQNTEQKTNLNFKRSLRFFICFDLEENCAIDLKAILITCFYNHKVHHAYNQRMHRQCVLVFCFNRHISKFFIMYDSQ